MAAKVNSAALSVACLFFKDERQGEVDASRRGRIVGVLGDSGDDDDVVDAVGKGGTERGMERGVEGENEGIGGKVDSWEG